MVCHFMNQQKTDTLKYCGIEYGPGETCNNLLQTSAANFTSIEHKLPLLISVEFEDELSICYTATASNGTYVIRTQGILAIGI